MPGDCEIVGNRERLQIRRPGTPGVKGIPIPPRRRATTGGLPNDVPIISSSQLIAGTGSCHPTQLACALPNVLI
jgi:hypothetical protein